MTMLVARVSPCASTIRSQVSQIGHRDWSRTPGIFRTVTESCTGHSQTGDPKPMMIPLTDLEKGALPWLS